MMDSSAVPISYSEYKLGDSVLLNSLCWRTTLFKKDTWAERLEHLSPELQQLGHGVAKILTAKLTAVEGIRIRQALDKSLSQIEDQEAKSVAFLVTGLQILDLLSQVRDIGNTRNPEDFEKWVPIPRTAFKSLNTLPVGLSSLFSEGDTDGWPSLFDGVGERLKHMDVRSSSDITESAEFPERERRVLERIVKHVGVKNAIKMFLNGDYVLLHLLFLIEGHGEFPADDHLDRLYPTQERLQYRHFTAPLMYLTNLTSLILLPATQICKNAIKPTVLWQMNYCIGNQLPPQVDQINFAILGELMVAAKNGFDSSWLFHQIFAIGNHTLQNALVSSQDRRFFNKHPEGQTALQSPTTNSGTDVPMITGQGTENKNEDMNRPPPMEEDKDMGNDDEDEEEEEEADANCQQKHSAIKGKGKQVEDDGDEGDDDEDDDDGDDDDEDDDDEDDDDEDDDDKNDDDEDDQEEGDDDQEKGEEEEDTNRPQKPGATKAKRKLVESEDSDDDKKRGSSRSSRNRKRFRKSAVPVIRHSPRKNSRKTHMSYSISSKKRASKVQYRLASMKSTDVEDPLDKLGSQLYLEDALPFEKIPRPNASSSLNLSLFLSHSLPSV
ncbi:hypothetical protein VKT23_008697 [Stygiomarasmius scandens]|uniref:Uncharacterized protein n=1 Tax=Marasmiellus scandens TaxID=2682957 RepID=A0ABR1JJZ1_9AGAR